MTQPRRDTLARIEAELQEQAQRLDRLNDWMVASQNILSRIEVAVTNHYKEINDIKERVARIEAQQNVKTWLLGIVIGSASAIIIWILNVIMALP